MRREYRERSAEEIASAREVRAARSAERQQIRRAALEEARRMGDQGEAARLARAVHLADLAQARRRSDEDRTGREDRTAAQQERRQRIVQELVDQWRRAAAERARRSDRPTSGSRRSSEPVVEPVPAGPRERAAVVAASPALTLAMGLVPVDQDMAAATRDGIEAAALAVSDGDSRRRPIRHAVVVPPRGESPEASLVRIQVVLAACGVDADRAIWAAMEHDGTGGDGQGRHLHLVWVSDGRDDRGGHAAMAWAAQVWAEASGRPEAAQGVSRGGGQAARRDWDDLEHSGSLHIRADWLAEAAQQVPNDPAWAGGLWLMKPGWKVSDWRDAGPTRHGRPRYGAGSHLSGLDG